MLQRFHHSPQATGWLASIVVHLAGACVAWAAWSTPTAVQLPRLPGQTDRIQLQASMASPIPEQVVAERQAETKVEILPRRATVAQRRYQATSTRVERPTPRELDMVRRWMTVPPSQMPEPPDASAEVAPIPDAASEALPSRAKHAPPAPTVRADVPLAMLSAPSRQTAGREEQTDPLLKSNPLPLYPAQAILDRIEGTVMLRVRVSATGSVDRVEVLSSSGYQVLDAEAIRTVRRWQFVPAQRDRQPAASWLRLPVRFKLD